MSKQSKWESIAAISSVVAAGIAVVAAVFAWQQIQDLRKTTKIQRLAEEAREFDTRLLAVRRNLACERLDADGKLKPLDPKNPPPEIYAILNYFEYLALLRERGALDEADILEVFGYWIDNFYPDSLPVIQHDQATVSRKLYEHFDVLAKLIKQKAVLPNDLADFYAYERRKISVMLVQSQAEANTADECVSIKQAKPIRTATLQ